MVDLIALERIHKSFGGVQALKGVSFNLRAGEVHSIVGENGAGKSTLMRVIGGEVVPSSGTIAIDGQTVELTGPRDATQRGISFIHQELALADDLTVAENIFMGRLPRYINHRALRSAARDVITRLGFSIDPGVQVGALTVAHKQVVEIAKALSKNARVLIFDEPTAVLATSDARRLLDVIRQLRSDGAGVVYISHRLNEVLELSDRITVMKDGSYVETMDAKDATVDRMISSMVGRRIETMFPPKSDRKIGDEVLKVESISTAEKLRDVSLHVRAGEIVGLGGLVGSGRTEVARAIFGADKTSGGTITLRGTRIVARSPRTAVRAGIGLVPEDRKGQGVILDTAIRINSTLAKLKSVTGPLGTLQVGKERRIAQQLGATMRLKAANVDAPVQSLSGGNQQKVALSKWFHADCDVLILDEPTRGVDVGAKSEIYKIISDLADAGKAIIVISSEHQELFGLCDRIVVMAEGAVAGNLTPENYSEEALLRMVMTHQQSSKEHVA